MITQKNLHRRLLETLERVETQCRGRKDAKCNKKSVEEHVELEFSPGFTVLGQCKEYFKPGVSKRDFCRMESHLMRVNESYKTELLYDYYVYGPRDRINLGSDISSQSYKLSSSGTSLCDQGSKCTRIREEVYRNMTKGHHRSSAFTNEIPNASNPPKTNEGELCKPNYKVEVQEKRAIDAFTTLCNHCNDFVEKDSNPKREKMSTCSDNIRKNEDIVWGVRVPARSMSMFIQRRRPLNAVSNYESIHKKREVRRDLSRVDHQRPGHSRKELIFPLSRDDSRCTYPIKLNAKFETRLSKKGIKAGAVISKFNTVRVSLRRSFTVHFRFQDFLKYKHTRRVILDTQGGPKSTEPNRKRTQSPILHLFENIKGCSSNTGVVYPEPHIALDTATNDTDHSLFSVTISMIRLWDGSSVGDAEDRIRNRASPTYSVEVEYDYVPFEIYREHQNILDSYGNPSSTKRAKPGLHSKKESVCTKSRNRARMYHERWATLIANDMTRFSSFLTKTI